MTGDTWPAATQPIVARSSQQVRKAPADPAHLVRLVKRKWMGIISTTGAQSDIRDECFWTEYESGTGAVSGREGVV
jgi:hypothetical protein